MSLYMALTETLESAELADADRCLTEDWPFDWTPPGVRDIPPHWWVGTTAQWADWHRYLVATQ